MQRKLIYRRGAIGDVIHTLPALKLLRKLEPDSRIDLVVGTEDLRSMLSVAAPYIDHIYVAGKKLGQCQELMDSLKLNPVDEFIYMHSGFWKAWYYQQCYIHAHELKCYQKDTSVGARENFALTIFPNLRSEILAKQYTNEIFKLLDYKCLESQSSPSNYVCIVPGVGHLRPSRAYPLDSWLEVISQLLRKTDLEIKILGGPDEEAMSHELFIALAAETKAIKAEAERKRLPIPKPELRLTNLVGKTSLAELLPILSGARLVMSADTGILHIATALGVRALSIYTVTSELRTGPHSPLATVLRSNSCACNPSFKNKGNEMKHCAIQRDGYAGCVWDISSAELLQKCYDSVLTT
jgi:ADP-heptose:LPS heptosyltransferase